MAAGLIAVGIPTRAAEQPQRLFAFDGPNGNGPSSPLVADSYGALYGTTCCGGSFEAQGIVYKLTPSIGGTYSESILHEFTGPDGSAPLAGVTIDGAGAIYGTTSAGGSHYGGTVFKLTPTGNGRYVETLLIQFDRYTGLADPAGGLTLDGAGSLYGTTSYGAGSVFKLTPNGNGYKLKVAHYFSSFGDGYDLNSTLLVDNAGNVYGTTGNGGPQSGHGTVFKLSPAKIGYQETILTTFHDRADYIGPEGLVADGAGVLYGTTSSGGHSERGYQNGYGLVFRLIPHGSGYVKDVLYEFKGGADGNHPFGSIVLDAAGNVYGATISGGGGPCRIFIRDGPGCGTVFKLTRRGDSFDESLLATFAKHTSGQLPNGVMLLEGGILLGTASIGGPGSDGTVFELPY